MQTSVLVVGAGPVGLAAAGVLLKAGVAVTVIDDQAAGANTSRAAVIHPRTLEVLETIGVTDELEARGLPIERFTVRDRDRALMPIEFGRLPSRYQHILMLPQSVTEQVLREKLADWGGRVERPRQLLSLRQSPDDVTATLADGAEVTADWVIGADGMHSTVRTAAGIDSGTDPSGDGGETFVLADIEATGGLSRTEVTLYFSRAGMVVAAPLPGGSFRIVAAVTDPPATATMADIQELLDQRGPQAARARVTALLWTSRFRIHHRVARTLRAGRVLLAGDAAHVHSPAGGQGMNLGIRDGVAVAEALAGLDPSSGDTSALDAYAVRHRQLAVSVVGLARRLTRMATVPAPVRPIRNTVLRTASHLPSVGRSLARQLAGLTDS
jgi:2-polyprenyl-6-methoxyphenol hydroxylase-like FAD-dependent oxidoreductase